MQCGDGGGGGAGNPVKPFGDESGLASLGVLHQPPNAGGVTFACAWLEGV